MLKKVLPYVLAAIVFFLALTLLRPAPSKTVVVAAHDLNAGHILVESDLSLQAMPMNAVSDDALTDIKSAEGQSLRLDRSTGDIIRSSNFGQLIPLQPDERAVAVKVSDTTGLAGLLVNGQKVGVIATIPMQTLDTQGIFSKVTIEGLRVLYVDPRFVATDSDSSLQPVGTPDAAGLSGVGGGVTTLERAQSGYVVLAIPTGLQTIMYDFSTNGSISQTRQVNALEMLAALSTTTEAQITLYLVPNEQATDFDSPGLWLPDLVVTPEPTETPTPNP
jgi:pilus assembly protein CpaB